MRRKLSAANRTTKIKARTLCRIRAFNLLFGYFFVGDFFERDIEIAVV